MRNEEEMPQKVKFLESGVCGCRKLNKIEIETESESRGWRGRERGREGGKQGERMRTQGHLWAVGRGKGYQTLSLLGLS